MRVQEVFYAYKFGANVTFFVHLHLLDKIRIAI